MFLWHTEDKGKITKSFVGCFKFCSEKNQTLQSERGISFEEIIALLESGKIIGIRKHPDVVKYPTQKIYLIDIDGYVWFVPFVRNSEEIFLKTAFPSRKATKVYKGDKK